MWLVKRNDVFYIRYIDSESGKERKISTKKTTRREALVFLSDFKKNLAAKQKVKFISLSDFKDEYLTHVKTTLSADYAITVRVSFDLLIKTVGVKPIKDITPFEAERFISETYQRTKHGAKTYYIALKSAFNKAVTWNYLSENPFTKVKIPKVPKNNPLFITEPEFNKILEKEPNPLMRDLFSFAFYTGARLGEIISLRWEAVSLNERLIRIANTETFTTKSKKERVVPIIDKLNNLLESRHPKILNIDRKELVFSKAGFPYNPDYISRRFKRAVIASGLNPKIHFHTLRHSFASNMVRHGVSIFAVKELCGHQDVSTTQIYSHLTVDSLREAVKALEA